MPADNRMHQKLAEFADMLLGIGVLYQIKLLGSKGLKISTLHLRSLNAKGKKHMYTMAKYQRNFIGIPEARSNIERKLLTDKERNALQ